MQERSENDISSGASRTTAPYLSWACATTRLRLPAISLRVSHLVVNLAKNGPGMYRSGEKKRLYTI